MRLLDLDKQNMKQHAISNIESDLDFSGILFLLMYKLYQDEDSTHNLAVFLSKYANECNFFKHNTTLIESLFIEVCNKNTNYYTLKEFGDFYFSLQKYTDSIEMYEQALTLMNNEITAMNLACSLFFEKEYSKINILIENMDIESINDEDVKLNFLIIDCFSLILLNNIVKAKAVFSKIKSLFPQVVTPDILLLAYYCEDYVFVVNKYKQVLHEWMIDTNTFNTICQSVYSCNQLSLNQHIKEICDYLNEFLRKNQEFDVQTFNEILSCVNGNWNLPQINYKPQFVWQIDFL